MDVCFCLLQCTIQHQKDEISFVTVVALRVPGFGLSCSYTFRVISCFLATGEIGRGLRATHFVQHES